MAASEGVQIHGGMGFIEETGAAQHYRDARIAPIYEGTNAIQALDLIGRKLGADGGLAAGELAADMRETLASLQGDLAGFGGRLSAGIEAMEAATAWALAHKGSAEALAGAAPLLDLFGDVAGGWMLAKGALADRNRAGLARLYGEHVLAAVPGRLAAVQAGVADLEG
jgi:hypothetical protein